MDMQEWKLLQILRMSPLKDIHDIAKDANCDLHTVTQSLSRLREDGYLHADNTLTEKALVESPMMAPRNAIILAAGFGMRMVPINLSVPKALLEVGGEPLVERTIKALRAVGIREIVIVVGFMKERFEYLVNEYDVELVANPDYAVKNNLSSLALVADRMANTYVIPSDIWCAENPFNSHEGRSWYMVSDRVSQESEVRVSSDGDLVKVEPGDCGNTMLGIAYLSEADACIVRERIKKASGDAQYDDAFWEIALYEGTKMMVSANVVSGHDVVEINTYEQLRELDGESKHLKSDALDVISDVFNVTPDDVVEIAILKKGMTNRSFLFSVCGNKYIMRIPGEGTDQLINRAQEATVFDTISGLGFCDDPVYINPQNGYKITRFLPGVRACDSADSADLKKCMSMLKEFHSRKLKVPHVFDIFGQIDFYETLWKGQPSMYGDYAQTKENVLSLKSFIDGLEKDWCLTHIDAVPDNFLFYKREGDEDEQLQLTDWEYSGMQDPHVDIAMFCIYSMYNKQQVDCLIDIYFENECDDTTRMKIYAYISMCGLLWSNWCEFKFHLGVDFGEYSLWQYRFAKEYYQYVKEFLGGKET